MPYKVLTLAITVTCIFSCKEIVVEFGSPNDYYIENSTTEELYYYTFGDSAEVVIPVNETVLIEETDPYGKISFTGDEFFNELSEQFAGDVFLYIEENGEKEAALKLNENEELPWEEEILEETENTISVNHTLTVTDEMIE